MSAKGQRPGSLNFVPISIRGLSKSNTKVCYFPDKRFFSSKENWSGLVNDQKLRRDASNPYAEPVEHGEYAGTGPTHIFRNAESLDIQTRTTDIQITDKGILAEFGIVVTPIDPEALASYDKNLEVMIIQEVRDIYLARYYRSANGKSTALNKRTEFNTEDPDGHVLDVGADNAPPAYSTPYCRKTCKVSDLKKGKALQATIRFCDKPVDYADLELKLEPAIFNEIKTFLETKKILGPSEKFSYEENEVAKLDHVEKYSPFRTWLVISDPNSGAMCPKFCFDWVSQYRIDVKEPGEYTIHPLCPVGNIPNDVSAIDDFSDGTDPRQTLPALVYDESNLPAVESEVVKNVETIANSCQRKSIYYKGIEVISDVNRKYNIVDSDAIGEEEEASLTVEWKIIDWKG